jgi:hypothetical protein
MKLNNKLKFTAFLLLGAISTSKAYATVGFEEMQNEANIHHRSYQDYIDLSNSRDISEDERMAFAGLASKAYEDYESVQTLINNFLSNQHDRVEPVVAIQENDDEANLAEAMRRSLLDQHQPRIPVENMSEEDQVKQALLLSMAQEVEVEEGEDLDLKLALALSRKEISKEDEEIERAKSRSLAEERQRIIREQDREYQEALLTDTAIELSRAEQELAITENTLIDRFTPVREKQSELDEVNSQIETHKGRLSQFPNNPGLKRQAVTLSETAQRLESEVVELRTQVRTETQPLMVEIEEKRSFVTRLQSRLTTIFEETVRLFGFGF